MALTRNQRDKIINEVKKLYIKEFDKSKNLRNELVDFIFDAILECLTPEEKEFTMKYQDYLNSVQVFDFTGDGVLKKEFPEENINCLNWGDNLYYFSKGIRIEKRIDGNLISAPSLFKGNEWSSFKHQSPELYKEALEKLREYVVVSKRACNKLFELEETLENKNLTLTALKTNFIELYNILKS